MAKKKNQIKSKIGAPPGSLIFVGEKDIDKTILTLTEYGEKVYNSRVITSFEELGALSKKKNGVKGKWLNVNGLQNVELISKIGSLFQIHPLTIEDILNSYHRPKADFFENGIFVVMKTVELKNGTELSANQVSFFLNKDMIISFQHNPAEDTFQPIYERIEKGITVLRKSKTDYLLYVLVDFVLDGYFLVEEELGEQIDDLQTVLLKEPTTKDLVKIQTLKKYLQKIRQAIVPVREILNSLLRRDSALINDSTNIYLRDTVDHQIHIVENLEMQRDTLTTMLDIYLSSINNRMNEVMKVLTIIATIFIPLTFIVGVYGMNFKHMPELSWKFGYPLIMILMFGIGGVLVWYFKKKKWF